MDYVEFYRTGPRRNIPYELLKTPNKFSLDELKTIYEELSDVRLQLPTREVFIFLILNYLNITTFNSKLNKRHVLEYGQILDLYLDKIINCEDPQQELIAAYHWLFRTPPKNTRMSFLRKKIINKISSFEDSQNEVHNSCIVNPAGNSKS
jgi:hypothetical protein